MHSMMPTPCIPNPTNAGPSGAGKSTLLDMLAHRKTIGRCEGRIAYNGQVITGARKMRKRSAYVPQEVRS